MSTLQRLRRQMDIIVSEVSHRPQGRRQRRVEGGEEAEEGRRRGEGWRGRGGGWRGEEKDERRGIERRRGGGEEDR